MKRKYLFVIVLLAVLLFASMGLTSWYVSVEEAGEDEGEVRIVTSFYPVYIAVDNIVGDTEGVTVTNLSEPKTGCMHDYQLTPGDMKTLSQADIFVVNGGGIESFLGDVTDQYPELKIVDACGNMELLGEESGAENTGAAAGEHDHEEEGHVHEEEDHDHGEGNHDHGEENAHVWMSTERYSSQIDTITSELSRLDEAHAKEYRENADRYLENLQGLQDEAQELRTAAEGQKVVLFHEAYAYVAEEYGMEAVYTLNLDEERQVSAGEVAEVIAQIRDNHITVVLAEELYGRDMGDTIEQETDAKVYYLDTLNRGDYRADSYLDAMRENIRILKEAFAE